MLIGPFLDETIRALRETQPRRHEEEARVIPVSTFISMPGGGKKQNALINYR